MGCYSVQCAVSGIPIYAEDCVMITVEKSKYPESGKFNYVPTNLPLFGRVDSYGRLEDHYTDEDYVLIKREIWDAAELFKLHENTYNGVSFDMKRIKESAERELEFSKQHFPSASNLSYKDHLSHYFLGNDASFYSCCENYTLKDLFFTGEQSVKCNDLAYQFASLYERSKFKDIIVNKIAEDNLTQEDLDNLTKICILWKGVPFLLGKDFIPVCQGFFCEQYTDKHYLKTRIDIFKQFNKVMRGMKK